MTRWIAIDAAFGTACGAIAVDIPPWLPIGVAVGAPPGTTQSRRER